MKSVWFSVMQLNERVRNTQDTYLFPSNHYKSEKSSYFFVLMEVLGWRRDNISTLVEKPPKKDKKDIADNYSRDIQRLEKGDDFIKRDFAKNRRF